MQKLGELGHAHSINSRVHPKYKILKYCFQVYRVGSWTEYDRDLVQPIDIEWPAFKHRRRGRRGWKKLHLGVDGSGVIVAQALTDGNTDDAKTALDLIDKIEGEIASVTADAAYDRLATYDAAAAPSAKVVVPPI